jgi:hypothetical protein
MNWINYDREKWSNQKLPKEKKWVLLKVKIDNKCVPDPIVVGYMKFAAGCKDSPYFISPGVLLQNTPHLKVYAWCDCLPKDFEWLK